ncbi:MAG TPA: hypothetical protein VMF09_11700 [Solirubrobacteraceae bacterium]|nr:hypothetical protein [Solirubrobacteraceae bacterium]
MTASFPLRYAHANVLIGRGGEAAGLYRLAMSSYPFLPVSGKWALAHRLKRLAHTVVADFSLWRVNRAYPAHRYIERNESQLDERHQDPQAWREFLEGHELRLAELGSHVPEVYLAVSLGQSTPTGLGSGLIRSVDRARRRVEELAGITNASPIPASEIEELAAAEHRVFQRVRGIVSARRATTGELQWLLRRAACRGIAEPEIEDYWTPDALIISGAGGRASFQPLSHDLERCANAAITEHAQALVVDGEQGRSHQALLALGSLADAPEFPGPVAEALYAPLEALTFPVDAVIHARWLGNREALAAVRKRIADVEHTYHEQVQGAAHGPSLLAGEDRVLAREYEAQLQAGGHPPMLYASIGLALGAPGEEELERRVAVVKEQYGDIQLHRPAGLQHRLWLDHLPRPDGWL